jgi:hypothetical protein
MEIKTKLLTYNITSPFKGEMSLSFALLSGDKAVTISKLDKLLTKIASHNKPLKINLDEWKEKRSKTSNDYAWELLGKISQKIKMPAVDIYRRYVYELQIKRQVKVDLSAADTIIKVWRQQGIAWLAEKIDEENGFARVDLYYGSSSFNTKQMYDLIQSIIADCQELGIETKTPDELAKLKGLMEEK